jgi:hypothetical protein
LEILLLVPLLIGAALVCWYLVHKESFKLAFLGKPNPVKQAPPSTDVERIAGREYGGTGYINEPIHPEVVVEPRHRIIKHDYYHAYGNERWPQWHCKCGANGYAITTPYDSLEDTEREARRDGQDHVRKAIQIDENLKKTNGNFAF